MTDRGQANLPSLAVALLVLTGTTVLGLTLASGALASADRAADERRTAVALGERLVAADSPVTDRENVLNQTRLDQFDGARLESEFPVAVGSGVEVSIGDEVHASTDEPAGGTTIRRLVHVAEAGERTVDPSVGSANVVALPRRADRVELTLTPNDDTRIETVRANGRVVLHDESGLSGTFDVALSQRQSVRLAFDANRTLSDGSAQLTVPTEQTTKATLAVTVDA